jgi:hypothetical protein
MPMRSLLVPLVLAGMSSLATGQSPDTRDGNAREPQKTSFVSLIKQRDGDLILVIEYPWKVHARTSIEVRLVTGENPKPVEAPPMRFLQTRMKGKVTEAVHYCLDRSAEVEQRKPFKADGLDFEILGRRSAMEKPSVCIVQRMGDKSVPGTAAAMLMLHSWAINEKLLYLDLPREEFSDAGKLHVWLLRGDTVLWKETVDWPGYAPVQK